MADSPDPTSASAFTESSAQEKARLRRERRAAKINAAGASRLQAITSLQGGSHRDVDADIPVKPASTFSQSAPTPAETSTPDPEEIDISQHLYTPASQPRLPSPFAFNGNSTPPFAAGQAPDPSQDEMRAVFQQLMGGGAGGMPGGSGQPGAHQPGDLPPGLANLFSAMQGGAEPAPSPEQSSAWVWRLVHSLFSLSLALWIVLQTPFGGSKLSRTSPTNDDWTLDSTPAEAFAHFFYLFATFEVVLQTSRYFIEKGQLQGSGILRTISQFLPEPYAGYVRMAGRYSVIYTTVVSDAMVVVFVLGAASWWRGGAVA